MILKLLINRVIKKLSPSKELLFLLISGFILRIAFINWDSGFHFHPDERMLIMVAGRIRFWSNLNPDFFNYGSLPVYILSATAQFLDWTIKTHLANYDGLLYVGRVLSTLTDIFVIYFVFRISDLLFKNKNIALWSSFFYTIAFFPIQNSHFFIVDTFLNLFATLLVYLLLLYLEKPDLKKLILISIVFAVAATSKVSAIIFLPIVLIVLILPFNSFKTFFKNSLTTCYFLLATSFFTFIFMPYAFIEYERFFSDILQQIKMNSDPFIFPYTLQYVGTLPYLYYLKNILLWGLGPMISILAIVGLVTILAQVINPKSEVPNKSKILKMKSFLSISYKLPATSYAILFLLFYLLYFAVIGRSAVKFMRYMLLMYPFFAILAGYGVYVILNLFQDLIVHIIPNLDRGSTFLSGFRIKSGMTMIIVFSTLLWTFLFLNIYSTKNTRIQATNWINRFIPTGSTLAVEHWDDRVPIFDPGRYKYEELTLYDIPDDQKKWSMLNEKLKRSDYIILASNRLYTPLQKLWECNEVNKSRCYPITAKYYQDLFSGKLGFFKVAEFTSYPRFCLLRDMCYVLRDDSSDESFTVYDHPKIMIFKKL